MATIVDRLKLAFEEGFTLGRKNSEGKNPYLPQEQALGMAWSEGFVEGGAQRVRDVYINQQRVKAEERRVAFEAKLTELLGGDDMRDEFASWLKELISSETSRHADY